MCPLDEMGERQACAQTPTANATSSGRSQVGSAPHKRGPASKLAKRTQMGLSRRPHRHAGQLATSGAEPAPGPCVAQHPLNESAAANFLTASGRRRIHPHWRRPLEELDEAAPLMQASQTDKAKQRPAASGWRRGRAQAPLLKRRDALLSALLGGPVLMLAASLLLSGAPNSPLGALKPATASMCQYHQAMLDNLSQQAASQVNSRQGHSASSSSSEQQRLRTAPTQASQHQGLIVCPKSSQHNNLPQQFQANSKLQNANFERQQRAILKSLNESFTQHLQLDNGVVRQFAPAPLQGAAGSAELAPEAAAAPPSSFASDLIDDELLNEIISPVVVDEAYQRAKEQIVKRRKLETELIRQGFVTDMSKPTAVARHQRVTTTTSRGNELEKGQEVFDEMSRILAQNLTNTFNSRAAIAQRLSQVSQLGNGRQAAGPPAGVDGPQEGLSAGPNSADQLEAAASELLERSDTNQLLSRIDLHLSEARHAVSRCEEDQQIVCDPNFPYRHADGRCNNLAKPTWGKANTCFARLLAPDYSDGQGAPRISVTGHPLPNPRILSAIVHRDFNYPATYTHFVMQYGQFFAHDIAFTPSSRTKSGSMIQCCPIERDSHPQCFPILVPQDDPFYSNWEESCLNFVRTAICPRCRLGPREQMNQITSFVDGSQVYGSAANETAALWTKSGPAGRMHVSFDDAGRELLPHSADPSNDQCSDIEKGQFCYRAGDRRVNQHPALTAVHTIWLRQHNRIVNGLKMINAHWNGDRLYQEAKRIATAQMQMVTYNEWLSLVIGQEAMKFLKLNVLPSGYTKYDPTVDPSLLNEFSGAAFRFGHSMINNIFAEILPDGRPSGYRLNEFFFHPFGLKAGQHDMVMRGLISQASQNRDPFVSSDIKNHLYRPRDNPYGLDLPAFNIQRGRDHGIPGYTKLVEFCFDDTITNWKQLDQYMPVSQRIRFSKLYRSVHDLDLFSAGLAEYPLPGAALGPTFTCIVGIQMFNLKYGDRFWFEHGGQVGSFTPDQLQEIRKANLARLVCVNSDNINVIQKNVFRGESPANPSVPCNTLPDTDLRAWKEEPGTQSIFAKAAEELGKTDESYSSNGATNGQNKKRHYPKQSVQEPLGYAFRSAAANQQIRAPSSPMDAGNSLGSDYAQIQMQHHHLLQNPQQQQSRMNTPRETAVLNRYQAVIKQGNVIVMQNNYRNGQQYQQARLKPTGGGYGVDGPRNMRPPFGMPTAPRAPHPRYNSQMRHQQRFERHPQQQQLQQQQQYQQQPSTPALSFEQVMQYSQPAG